MCIMSIICISNRRNRRRAAPAQAVEGDAVERDDDRLVDDWVPARGGRRRRLLEPVRDTCSERWAGKRKAMVRMGMVIDWAPVAAVAAGGLLSSSFRAFSCTPSAPSPACLPSPSGQVGRGSGGGGAGRGVAARMVAPLAGMMATAAATKIITTMMKAETRG